MKLVPQRENPTLSLGISLNSVPCFKNTFPARKKKKNVKINESF